MARRKKAAVARKVGTSGGKRHARSYSFAGDDNPLLHQLFQRQAEQIIATANASEEEKQHMLMALNCPCCGLGGSSFRVKLKGPAKTAPPRFLADDAD